MSVSSDNSEVSARVDGTEKSCDADKLENHGDSADCGQKDSSQPCDQRKKPPRSERKRLFRQQKLAEQKLRRLQKRDERRQQKADNDSQVQNEDVQHNSGDQTELSPVPQDQDEHVPKKRKIELMKERQKQALSDGQKIAIDCSLEKHMSPKECSKLAQQLCRLYGCNRRSEHPAHLYFTGLSKSGHLYSECVRKNAGFENYMVTMTELHHSEVFPTESVICLSPDSPNVLSSIEKEKVYIIGGLVDEYIQKGKSMSSAESLDIATARLPLDEYMEKTESGTFKKVLTVNQVFAILLKYAETNDWKVALNEWVPARHGFRVKFDDS